MLLHLLLLPVAAAADDALAQYMRITGDPQAARQASGGGTMVWDLASTIFEQGYNDQALYIVIRGMVQLERIQVRTMLLVLLFSCWCSCWCSLLVLLLLLLLLTCSSPLHQWRASLTYSGSGYNNRQRQWLQKESVKAQNADSVFGKNSGWKHDTAMGADVEGLHSCRMDIGEYDTIEEAEEAVKKELGGQQGTRYIGAASSISRVRRSLGTFCEGNCFGEMSLLLAQTSLTNRSQPNADSLSRSFSFAETRMCSAHAVEDSELLFLPRAQLRHLVENYPSIAYDLKPQSLRKAEQEYYLALQVIILRLLNGCLRLLNGCLYLLHSLRLLNGGLCLCLLNGCLCLLNG